MKKISKLGIIVLVSSILMLIFTGCGVKEDQLNNTTWEYHYSNGVDGNCKEVWTFSASKEFSCVNYSGDASPAHQNHSGTWSLVDGVLEISTDGYWKGSYEVELKKDTLTLTCITGPKNCTLKKATN